MTPHNASEAASQSKTSWGGAQEKLMMAVVCLLMAST